MATTPETEAKTESVRKTAQYVVLQRVSPEMLAELEPADKVWVEVNDAAEGRIQREAMDAAIPADASGTFVAPPKKSWKPTTITSETKTRRRYS